MVLDNAGNVDTNMLNIIENVEKLPALSPNGVLFSQAQCLIYICLL